VTVWKTFASPVVNADGGDWVFCVAAILCFEIAAARF
jgi:hypothetical protein